MIADIDDYAALLDRIQSVTPKTTAIPIGVIRKALRSLTRHVPTRKAAIGRDTLIVVARNGALRFIVGDYQHNYARALPCSIPPINLCRLPFTVIKKLTSVVHEQDASATVVITQSENDLILEFSCGGVYRLNGLDCGSAFADINFKEEKFMNWESDTPDWKQAQKKKQNKAIALLINEIASLTPTVFERMARQANIKTRRAEWIAWVKAGNAHEHLFVSWEEFVKDSAATKNIISCSTNDAIRRNPDRVIALVSQAASTVAKILEVLDRG